MTSPTPNNPIPVPSPEPSGGLSLLSEMRGGGGEAGAAESTPPGPSRRLKVPQQTVVVGLVVLVSIAAIYGMRKRGMNSGFTFQTPKIEYDAKRVSLDAAQQAKILRDLAASAHLPKAASDHLDKNPFQLEGQPVVEATDDGSAARLAEERRRAQSAKEREERIQQALGTLELNGVMGGPIPLARIGGRTVKVGDTVAEVFIVAQVHDRSVDLLADGKIFTIAMPEGIQSKDPRRGGGGSPRR